VGGEVLREGAERRKSAGVASLRGQGTPAYPARLRSERARNSLKNISYHKAVQMLQIQLADFLPPQQIERL